VRVVYNAGIISDYVFSFQAIISLAYHSLATNPPLSTPQHPQTYLPHGDLGLVGVLGIGIVFNSLFGLHGLIDATN